MSNGPKRLRVALLAGTLGQGGSEKQLVFMARALLHAGADVRVYSLTRGEFYESHLQAMGLDPLWVGRLSHPMLRLFSLARMLRRFRPHVIQSAHAYANLYAGLLGRWFNRISIGAMRSSYLHSRRVNGLWTRWLVRTPSALVANSQAVIREMSRQGIVRRRRLFLLPSVVDLSEYTAGEQTAFSEESPADRPVTAVFIGRLVPVKRVERFLAALSRARARVPRLQGLVIGDGPQRRAMEKLAGELELLPGSVQFLGQQNDVPQRLQQADMLVVSSEDEGLPNVVLEAMASRRPVITTPAGDAALTVQDGVTGYVVPFDDVEAMARRMAELAESAALRQRLGAAGRRRVEEEFSCEHLADRLLSIYHDVAQQQGHQDVVNVLPAQ